MFRATKTINEGGLFYIWKDHFCPVCGDLLEVAYIEKVVNSKSPEAKEYNFSMVGRGGIGVYVGDVLFRIRCFYCNNCRKAFRVKEVKSAEKKAIKSERQK